MRVRDVLCHVALAVVEVALEDGTTRFGFVGGAKGTAAASIIGEQ